MAIITKIETLRKFVKLSATSTSAAVMPDFDMPEWKYLLPILGNDLYAQLGENIATEGWGDLLDMSRAVIAPMAVYHDLAFMQATLTDTGIKVMSSDSMQSAPKWVFRELRESLLEKASFATERLIEHLLSIMIVSEASEQIVSEDEQPLATVPYTWTNESIQHALFKTGKDFCRFHFIQQPYRTFIQMLPVIIEVEDHYLRPTFGEAFYDAFKTAAVISANEKALIDLIKKAVANLTISKAIESLSVKVTVQGFTVKMADDTDDPYKADKQATDRQLEMKRSATLETGTRYLLQAKAYADKVASAEIFPLYFASDKYIPAAPADGKCIIDDNANRNGVFAF